MGTNTRMSPPVCENCGRDKQPTYICDACIDKLNAGSRALFAERDAIRAELQRRLDAVVAAMRPTDEDDRLREFSNAACDRYGIKQRLYRRASEIAEGRDNG